jgi:hypothetical protein
LSARYCFIMPGWIEILCVRRYQAIAKSFLPGEPADEVAHGVKRRVDGGFA